MNISLYLRKRDLQGLIKTLEGAIAMLDQSDCARSLMTLRLGVLKEIFTDYYEKGLWVCPACNRQIHDPKPADGRCPKCYVKPKPTLSTIVDWDFGG